jgi:hypothetical protein
MARVIRGGKFAESGMTYDDLDPEQLQMGIEIEQEHTPDIEIATKIASDHLSEIPMYYSYLTDMEALAKEDMGNEEPSAVQDGEGGQDGESSVNDKKSNSPAQEQVQSTGTNNNSETPFQS